MTPAPTLDVLGAAQALGISSDLAYRSIKDGTFPVEVLRLGRAIRIPRRPLEQALGLEDGALA